MVVYERGPCIYYEAHELFWLARDGVWDGLGWVDSRAVAPSII